MDPKSVTLYGTLLSEGKTTHLGGTGARNSQVKGQEHGLVRKEKTFMNMVGGLLRLVMDSANKKIPEILFNRDILLKRATSRVAQVPGCDEWETVFKPIAGHLIIPQSACLKRCQSAIRCFRAQQLASVTTGQT